MHPKNWKIWTKNEGRAPPPTSNVPTPPSPFKQNVHYLEVLSVSSLLWKKNLELLNEVIQIGLLWFSNINCQIATCQKVCLQMVKLLNKKTNLDCYVSALLTDHIIPLIYKKFKLFYKMLNLNSKIKWHLHDKYFFKIEDYRKP